MRRAAGGRAMTPPAVLLEQHIRSWELLASEVGNVYNFVITFKVKLPCSLF